MLVSNGQMETKREVRGLVQLRYGRNSCLLCNVFFMFKLIKQVIYFTYISVLNKIQLFSSVMPCRLVAGLFRIAVRTSDLVRLISAAEYGETFRAVLSHSKAAVKLSKRRSRYLGRGK
jgi:hypothetical protein